MSADRRGLLDTNIVIRRAVINAALLPDEVAITAITLAELSAGVQLVPERAKDARAERARRLEILQRVENEFDPLPFDAEAARIFARLCGAVQEAGRSPRRRIADLMIASIAIAHALPLYTSNPADFAGLGEHVRVVAVPVT